jgi:glycosyltransferase involved in cell wall biosynthesis
LSSEFEALPLVLMEAKTFGIPCVSFDVETGPNEVIRDNIDGYLVPFPDCQRFAEKTIQLIENIDLRKEMGNLARIDAKSKFDPIEIYNKWDELLNQLPK